MGDAELTDLVEHALADNPDLAAAEARVREARALARATGASLWPKIDAAGDVSRDKLSRNGENLALIPFTPPTTEFTDYRVGLDLSWEIDLAGGTRRQMEAATARFGSQTETRNDARVVVAAEVASAYIDERTATHRAALARRSVEILSETARLVRLEYQAGLASQSDLERAESDELASSALPASWDAADAVARAQLAALTGESPAALAAQLGAAGDLPAVPDVIPVGLPSDLLRRRPDIRLAERELAAATADVGSAVAAQFPQLSLTGDGGFDSVRSGDLVRAASRFFNLAPQLSVPLFNAGRLRREVEAAEAARDAALASYRSTVLRAFADAEGAVVQLASGRKNAAGLAASATTLDAAFRLERLRFEAGDISAVELLAAEQAANRAADRGLDAAGAAGRAFVALNKALGGGWQQAR
jgi:NodT family efflux transporter outer membrane factor (OMF) lipoprotein